MYLSRQKVLRVKILMQIHYDAFAMSNESKPYSTEQDSSHS